MKELESAIASKGSRVKPGDLVFTDCYGLVKLTKICMLSTGEILGFFLDTKRRETNDYINRMVPQGTSKRAVTDGVAKFAPGLSPGQVRDMLSEKPMSLAEIMDLAKLGSDKRSIDCVRATLTVLLSAGEIRLSDEKYRLTGTAA